MNGRTSLPPNHPKWFFCSRGAVQVNEKLAIVCYIAKVFLKLPLSVGLSLRDPTDVSLHAHAAIFPCLVVTKSRIELPCLDFANYISYISYISLLTQCTPVLTQLI